MPKCRQNYTMGIKLPWTLADEDNWNRTHRMAGYVWTAGGILMLIVGFFHLASLFFLVFMAMVPDSKCVFLSDLPEKAERNINGSIITAR